MSDSITSVAGAALCVVLGAIRTADLIFFVDPATGFAQAGEAWYRYLGTLAAVAVLFFISRRAHQKPASLLRSKAALGSCMLLAGGLMVESGVSTLLARSDAFAMPRGITLAVSGVWFAVFGLQSFLEPPKKPLPVVFGLPMLAAPFWLTVERFAMEPASVARMNHIFGVLSAVGALCMADLLLKVVFAPRTPIGRSMFFYGLTAFLLCTCLGFPQVVLEFTAGTADLLDLVLAGALAMLGLCGLVCAAYSTGRQLPSVKHESL